MAAPMTAAQFAAALRAEGLTVEERSGWAEHNRNSKGAWGPLNGVMIHHTVSADGPGIIDLCSSGRTDLPGPLCHGVIHKDGSVTLVGWGRANHAGAGDPDVLAAVVNESPTHPTPGSGTVDGNAHFVGYECVNWGDGKDPWPEAQLDAIARASAAVCRKYGWSAESVIGHKEWTNQKVDPRGFTMAAMRARVAERLEHPASWDPGGSTPEEDDMQLSDQVTLGTWVPKKWPQDSGLQDGQIQVNTALGSAYGYSRQAAEGTTALLAQVAALSAVVGKLAEGGGLDASEIQAAAQAGAQAALDRLGDALKDSV